jgi:undecaprenyl-diphosphatase
MTVFHLVLVAIVQGITEFLPISSSAHLILAPKVTGSVDQGPLIDVAVHVGTLIAVLIAFRRDVAEGFVGLGDLARGRFGTDAARLARNIIVATIPLVVIGFVLHEIGIMDWVRSDENNRAFKVIGWTTLIFGVLLYIADTYAPTRRRLEDTRFGGAIAVGLAQAVALIPGTSRSGITMTAARFLGLSRTEAARFSMLLAIPAIIAGGIIGALDIVESGNMQLGLDALIAAGLSCIAALIAIKLFMGYIAGATMTPFVIYRLILGSVLLGIAYL